MCPQTAGKEDDAALPSSIRGRAPRKAPGFVVSSSSESPRSAGCPIFPSLSGWILCWHTGPSQGLLSEKAASIWHSPDSGLAQSARPRFKAAHALESTLGATLVSECTGAPVAKCWPFFPWPPPAVLPSALETALLSQSL